MRLPPIGDILSAMGPDRQELLDFAVEGVAASFRRAPGFEIFREPGAGGILTGEPIPTFNMLYLGPECDPAVVLPRFVARIRRRRAPVYILVSQDVVDQASPIADEFALLPDPDEYPLMTYEPPQLPPSSSAWRVERATGGLEIARTLIHRATGIDPSICDRVLPDSSLGACTIGDQEVEVDYYLAFDRAGGEDPRSTVRTTRHHGPDGVDVGIWSMSTPPEHQRRGAGKALLQGMIRDQMERGARRFFLCSTPAGRRLYASAGFRIADPWKSWSDGLSAEELAAAY